MKFIIAVIITALITTFTPPVKNINKMVATNSKSTKSTVQAQPKAEDQAKATPKVETQEQTVTPIVTNTVPTCDSFDSLIAENFGAENLITAKAVMRAESSCRTDAVGDGHITFVQDGVTYGMSCGLFQIRYLPGRPTCEQMKNPSENIRYAGQLFKGQGFYPWSAYKNGLYKRYL